jgi:pimeloyl-ACP methyl ester carboxylesterase
MADRIPDARFVEIQGASHLPLWEDRETHTSVVEFLDSVR